jgi:hypothetical protein
MGRNGNSGGKREVYLELSLLTPALGTSFLESVGDIDSFLIGANARTEFFLLKFLPSQVYFGALCRQTSLTYETKADSSRI